MPRVPQHPPDEMPDEGATTGTSHHARLQARASASAANSCAPALDDEQARRPRLLLLDKGSPLQCQHDAHGSPGGPTRDHWFLPAIRATTHLEGKASGSSRRRTPAARLEQARAGPATRGAHIWAKASAGTRRRLLAGSMDAGRTSSLLMANRTTSVRRRLRPAPGAGHASRAGTGRAARSWPPDAKVRQSGRRRSADRARVDVGAWAVDCARQTAAVVRPVSGGLGLRRGAPLST
jgi:hypothetical protein